MATRRLGRDLRAPVGKAKGAPDTGGPSGGGVSTGGPGAAAATLPHTPGYEIRWGIGSVSAFSNLVPASGSEGGTLTELPRCD